MKRMIIAFLLIPLFFGSALTVQAEEKWQQESIYYIVVDRFMNGSTANDGELDLEDPSAYHGGDLSGVRDQLDYIKELGFTTIQLSPIMSSESDGFHGFGVTDYETVEEHFGTMEDARKLVAEAHEKGMKVIFDMPYGFVGNAHPWLEDQRKSSWFLEETLEGDSWFDGLPKLDTSNPEVADYYSEVWKKWEEETDVDGFRLITSGGAAPQNDLLVFSETYDEEKEEQQTLRDVFQAAGASLEPLALGEGEQIWELDDFLGSRFTHEAVEEGQNPVTRLQLAWTYLYTIPGTPRFYYGSEIPLDDGGDPSEIPMMNFKAGEEALSQRIEKLHSMREEFPALTKGSVHELYNEDGLLVYERSYEGERLIIAINNAEATKTMELDHLEGGLQLSGLLEDGIIREQRDGVYRIGMERETADVFVVEADKGYNWLFIGFVGGVLLIFVLSVTMISIKNRKDQTVE